MDGLQELTEKVDRLIVIVTAIAPQMVAAIREEIVPSQDHYDTERAARLLNLAPYTVRQKCNLGKIKGERSNLGAGPHGRWVISRQEIERYLREGDRRRR